MQGSGGRRRDALENAPAGAREHGDANRHGDKGQEGGSTYGRVGVEHLQSSLRLFVRFVLVSGGNEKVRHRVPP